MLGYSKINANKNYIKLPLPPNRWHRPKFLIMCCVGNSVGQQALSCIVDGSKNCYNS